MTDDGKYLPGASAAIGVTGSLSVRKTSTGTQVTMTTDEKGSASFSLASDEWDKFIRSQYPIVEKLANAEADLHDVLDKLAEIIDENN